MEGRRRRDSPSLSPVADLAVNQACEKELSLSESESELELDMISNSFFTVENSEVRFHPIEGSAKTAWTNEKHDLYLDQLESSFVKQLHRSILKNHPGRAGKQCFVRAAKMQDSGTAMNLCPQDENSFFSEAGLSTEQMFERHGKSLDYFEEFSDQNFPDEASEQRCVTTMSKRSNTIVS